MPPKSHVVHVPAVVIIDRHAERISIDLFDEDRAIFDAVIERGPQRYHAPQDNHAEFWSKTVDDRRYQISITLHTEKGA